jgi:hypothetical protein
MKRLLPITAVAAFLYCTPAHAWDFVYGYHDPYSANAQDYTVAQLNLQRTSEASDPEHGVSYWHPDGSSADASITYKFSFAQPTTTVYLFSHIATFDFGGGNSGFGSLWGSTDGSTWTLLMDAPKPAGRIDQGYFYDGNLPASLTGSSDLWIQARLQTSGWNIMAQFSRADTAAVSPDFNIFQVNATLVPEPTSLSLMAMTFVATLLRRKGSLARLARLSGPACRGTR